jgi:hypothetical protein
MRAFATRDEERLPAHRPEGADGAVDAARDDGARLLEEFG